MANIDEQLRELLRRDKVKLWLEPYTNSATGLGNIPQEMIEKYATATGYRADAVSVALEKLRLHACQRLQANETFRQDGTATLNVSVVSPDSRAVDERRGPVLINLEVLGSELRSRVAEKFSLHSSGFRLVAAGKIVEDSRLLSSQNIAHGMDVLCICLSDAEQQAVQHQQWESAVHKSRDAARKLAGRNPDDFDDHVMQITDQEGKTVHLPDAERQAIVVALSMHEKGRTAIKRKEYGRALLFLLEADQEFSQCRSEILQAVDNYAVLCLDIVWCYLCLENVSQLPDAEAKLAACERCFRRTYGRNLERVAALKNTVAQEKALLTRLRLLQGILAFYKRDFNVSMTHLLEAESYIKELEVDDEKLIQVISLGYTETQARLALRATGGNVEASVDLIIRELEEERVRKAREREEAQQRRLQRRLGKTRSDEPVNIVHYNSLLAMGFAEGAAIKALKESNNDLNVALELLRVTTAMDTGTSADSNEFAQREAFVASLSQLSPDELFAQAMAMGFPQETVQEVLQAFDGNWHAAVDQLFATWPSGLLPPPPQTTLPSGGTADGGSVASGGQTNTDSQSTQSASVSSQITANTDAHETSWHAEDDEAWEQLNEDISRSPHDHLDLDLREEQQFLDHYKQLLLLQ